MTKKQKTFFIIIAILIGIGAGVLFWLMFTPSLGKGVFYYLIEDDKADLFLITNKDNGKKIISISAREIDLGNYKPPRHSYFSHNGQQMIYFKEIGEMPLENVDESIVISRIISEPVLVNLKTGKERKIEQPIDSSALVFSPDDTQIAWIKEVSEATYQSIEESNKKRELWISRADGENAQLLYGFDENVVLLKHWYGDYVYFHGIWDVFIRSMGRINVKTRKIEYLIPQYCEKFLENCQNIEFSNSGPRFLYEIYNKTEDKEITELYLGDFEKREFQTVLTTDRISDRLWLNNERGFFYTEQELVREEGGGGEKEIREKIHLVDVKNQTDDTIYEGSYISQLAIGPDDKYLYFLEKDRSEENNFNLVKLNIKTKEANIILTKNYNHILLIQQ